MNQTFFTSDTHFGHANAITFDRRPFADVDEMDRELIARWNDTVSKDDQVWHLGDFCCSNKKPVQYYTEQLNGAIHLIYGNHDDHIRKKHHRLFASCHDAHYLRLEGEKIVLYHYGQRTWRTQHRGSWHLYGHSHGSLPSYGLSLDVGCMNHDYRPISFDTVLGLMSARDLAVPDAHRRPQ